MFFNPTSTLKTIISLLLLLPVTVSALTVCTPDTPFYVYDICGFKGLINNSTSQAYFIKNLYDVEHLTPSGCAQACYDDPKCTSFDLSVAFCGLYSRDQDTLGFVKDALSIYEGWDSRCFKCVFVAATPSSTTALSTTRPLSTTTTFSSSSKPSSTPTSVTQCTPKTVLPPASICGPKVSIAHLDPNNWIKDLYDVPYLTPTGCARTCAADPLCVSFGVSPFNERAFCMLLRGTLSAIGFQVDVTSKYEGWDLSCFDCVDVPVPILALVCTQEKPFPEYHTCGIRGFVNSETAHLIITLHDAKYLTPEGCAQACFANSRCTSFDVSSIGEAAFCALQNTFQISPFNSLELRADASSPYVGWDRGCFHCTNVVVTTTPGGITSTILSSVTSIRPVTSSTPSIQSLSLSTISPSTTQPPTTTTSFSLSSGPSPTPTPVYQWKQRSHLPTNYTCNQRGYITDEDFFIKDLFEAKYLTPEGCAQACYIDDLCYSFDLSAVGAVCKLQSEFQFSLGFTADTTSNYVGWDSSCFECSEVVISSSTTSSTTSTSSFSSPPTSTTSISRTISATSSTASSSSVTVFTTLRSSTLVSSLTSSTGIQTSNSPSTSILSSTQSTTTSSHISSTTLTASSLSSSITTPSFSHISSAGPQSSIGSSSSFPSSISTLTTSTHSATSLISSLYSSSSTLLSSAISSTGPQTSSSLTTSIPSTSSSFSSIQTSSTPPTTSSTSTSSTSSSTTLSSTRLQTSNNLQASTSSTTSSQPPTTTASSTSSQTSPATNQTPHSTTPTKLNLTLSPTPPASGANTNCSTSTIYTTQTYTISSCAPEVAKCLFQKEVVTVVSAVRTTVYALTGNVEPTGSESVGGISAAVASVSKNADVGSGNAAGGEGNVTKTVVAVETSGTSTSHSQGGGKVTSASTIASVNGTLQVGGAARRVGGGKWAGAEVVLSLLVAVGGVLIF